MNNQSAGANAHVDDHQLVEPDSLARSDLPVNDINLKGQKSTDDISNIIIEKVGAEYTDGIEDRVKLIADHLSIQDERAWFLAAMFNSDFYAATYDLKTLPEHCLFQHFLEQGIPNNYTPSPAFDPVFAAAQLDELDEDEPKVEAEDAIFLRWLKYGFDTVEPHALFDTNFYLDLYSDLAGSVRNPYAHFATSGIYENRISCEFLQKHVNAVYTNFAEEAADIYSLFCSIPVGYSDQFAQRETQVVFKKLFMPELYQKQLDIEGDYNLDVLYSHYLVKSCENAKRPTVLFNKEWYLKTLGEFEFNDNATDTLREFKPISIESAISLKAVGLSNAFMHWYFCGVQLDIVPTPLFDVDHYIFSHPDIRNNWQKHPFLHFIETGYKERYRRFSSLFENNYYIQQATNLDYNSALLDYTMRGQFDGISTVSGLNLDIFVADAPYECSNLEHAAIYYHRRLDKLVSGPVAAMVAKATELEPQTVRPYGARLVRLAPLFHPESDLMHNMRKIVPNLAKDQYDVIVLMPHCRLAGSANVAGQLAKTLANLTDKNKILILTTDLSSFDRPDWFPEAIDIFDLSQFTEKLTQERKIRILLDLVRGLRPKKIINVNSNLGWHLTNTFGKQLSAWMDIYFYLFCWDRDFKGNKGGYPIQWFLPTFNFCKAVLTDNSRLTTELRERYCLTENMRNKIVTLHTPAAETEVNYFNALAERGKMVGVKRVFWSGRFDRQKRIDVLFATARRMPDTEFWVWGKSVLNDSAIGTEDAPENIRIMGTYKSIDDLPIASCDCFLYTSGWDGLPIILIDVASRGIPIVASKVGGVGDLVSESTGWPVEDYANPDAYCTAIESVLADYPAALEKAKHARTHALELCSESNYRETLNQALRLDQLEQL